MSFSLRPRACATRLGLLEGFAVGLRTARANGTMWDLSLEDDRAELRRVQNREQPELLAGSPPSDDFNSLLNTRVESQEISKLKTERESSHRSALVYKLTSCRWQCRSTSFMNIHKDIHELGNACRFQTAPCQRTRRVAQALMVKMCRWTFEGSRIDTRSSGVHEDMQRNTIQIQGSDSARSFYVGLHPWQRPQSLSGRIAFCW